jgi:oligopeptide transport system substrate-binding protein
MNANNTIKQQATRKHTFLLRYFFIVLSACLFCACSQQKSSEKKVFNYNETTGIATLDPAFAKNQSIMWSVHQLYNTLVEIDSGLNIVPSIAKSWEVSADRLTYTFHLQKICVLSRQ